MRRLNLEKSLAWTLLLFATTLILLPLLGLLFGWVTLLPDAVHSAAFGMRSGVVYYTRPSAASFIRWTLVANGVSLGAVLLLMCLRRWWDGSGQ